MSTGGSGKASAAVDTGGGMKLPVNALFWKLGWVLTGCPGCGKLGTNGTGLSGGLESGVSCRLGTAGGTVLARAFVWKLDGWNVCGWTGAGANWLRNAPYGFDCTEGSTTYFDREGNPLPPEKVKISYK